MRLEAERRVAEPGDLVYVRVLVSDDAGMVEMLDDRMLTAHVEGGELLAFGSARPRTEERYDVGAHTTYFGRAQAVVRMGTKDVTLVVRDERAEGREERAVIRVGA